MAIKLEIERKYLLKRLPFRLKYGSIFHIIQYYLPDGRRIRATRNAIDCNPIPITTPFPFGEVLKYEVAIKKRLKAGVYKENEKEITHRQFNNLKDKAESIITKTRYVYKVGRLKWEIDVYQGDMNMVTAEIELKSEKSKFTMPKEIKKELIMDVTEFREFTNKSLADKLG